MLLSLRLGRLLPDARESELRAAFLYLEAGVLSGICSNKKGSAFHVIRTGSTGAGGFVVVI